MPMNVVTANGAQAVTTTPKERLTSLDQYRGFVILCSLIVPLLGQLDAAPSVFKHERNFFSIAGSFVLDRGSFMLGRSLDLLRKKRFALTPMKQQKW